jgi:hypothetical protein
VRGGKKKDMQLRVLTRIAVLALLTVPLLVSGAGAALISYDLTGFDAAGDPVAARVDFFTGTNSMTVDITNLLPAGSVKNIGQNVSGVQFTLSSGQSNGTLGANPPNTQQSVLATGFGFPLAPVAGPPTGWSLQPDVNNGLGKGIGLCVACVGGNAQHTLIGGAPGANYSNSDSSIREPASVSNPFFDVVLHFVVDIPGLQGSAATGPGDYVDSAFLTFGTSQKTLLQAHCTILSCLPERHRTPEPSSLLLVGAGLLGLAGFSLRKRLNTK